ncbi:MAG: hypothetical protein ACLFV8_07925 [Alphaproteobacteria bacterium]
MAIRDCIPEIRNITGGRLNDEQITQIIEELQRRHKERLRTGRAERDADALMQEAQEMAAQVDLAAKIEKRNRAINVLARKQLREFVAQAGEAGLNPKEAMQARIVGVNKPVPGGRLSVDARGVALLGEYMGGMVADLRRAGVLEFLTRRGGVFGDGRGSLDLDVARELRAVSGGEGPATGSKEARTIAEIIHRHQERARQRLNRAGGWVGKRWDYIVRQSHDQMKVSSAGFDEWFKVIRPLLDEEATFGDADPEKFLKGAYDGIASGEHLRADMHGTNPPEGAFKGPANLAKKVSRERTLHFKDAYAWYEYNQRFGTQSLTEAVVSGMETAARATALMETFGTNPRAMFDSMLEELRQANRANPELVRQLRDRDTGLDVMFRTVDGTTRQSVNPTAANIWAGVRAVQDMAKLGGATVTAISDIPLKASELRWQGKPLGQAYVDALATSLEGFAPDDLKVISDLYGTGIDGIIGEVNGRFTATDNLPGRMGKLQRLFFKLNLLTPWTDGHRRGVARMMARDLAMDAHTPYADLPDARKRMFSAYGIGPEEWDVIRSASRTTIDGNEYIMADALRDLDDAALGPRVSERMEGIRSDIAKRRASVEKRIRALEKDLRTASEVRRPILERDIQAERNKLQTLPAEEARRLRSVRQRELDRLETALRSMVTDRVQTALLVPGARERAILHQGEMRGTVRGEAMRLLTQFKSFPTAIATKVLGREFAGASLREIFLQGKGDWVGVTSLLAGTTIMGMMAMQAKEILKGRNPRDPFGGEEWGAVWRAAFLQGGGLGIYGDLFLGETNRFGRSLLDTLAGPTLGTIADLDELRAKIIAGDRIGPSTLRVAQANTPFANLFYTKAALDYLVIYHLQHAMDPDYLRRMERRVERENNQTFLLRPSEAVQ